MRGRDRDGRFILTFHGLGEPGAHVASEERQYWVSREAFCRIVEFAAISPQAHLPPIEFSFDDGNVSDFEIAFPALVERQLPGSFFVLAGRVGKKGYLSKSEIRRLSEAGMTVGSHGWDHIDWRRATPQELYRELRDARSYLEDILGRRVSEIAIPFGGYNKHVYKQILNCRYDGIFSSDGGTTDRSQPTPRNTIKGSRNIEELVNLINRKTKLYDIMRRKTSRIIKTMLW